jgi:hypothetical protein
MNMTTSTRGGKGVYCWSGMTDASGKLVSQISTLLVSLENLKIFATASYWKPI